MRRKKITIIVTILLLLLCGCSDASPNKPTLPDKKTPTVVLEETTSSPISAETTESLTEATEITTEPKETAAPTITDEGELTLDGFVAFFMDIYVTEFDMSLSNPVEVKDGDTIMYRYAIKDKNGTVLPCTINVVCNESGILDSVIVAYYEGGDSSLVQQIVDVWAYVFASFNQSLSPLDGYGRVMKLYDSGDFEEGGYTYYYYEDKLTAGIRYS